MSRTVLAAALAALAAAPVAAGAQASPRYGSFEIRAQNYRPDIDSEFAGKLVNGAPVHPFQDIFGTGRTWGIGANASYSVFKEFGTLDVGLGAGWFRFSGKGRFAIDGTQSTDSTRLHIFPTSALVTYRFDWLVERYGFPIAPYARASFERYNWMVTNGSGHTTKSGATNGYSVTAGGALLLDFFDPGLAREMDRDTGINHTYAFFDVTKSVIDDFGSSKSWDMSDTSLTLAAGMMFVF